MKESYFCFRLDLAELCQTISKCFIHEKCFGALLFFCCCFILFYFVLLTLFFPAKNVTSNNCTQFLLTKNDLTITLSKYVYTTLVINPTYICKFKFKSKEKITFGRKIIKILKLLTILNSTHK